MDEYTAVTFANRDESIPDSIATGGDEKSQESENTTEKPKNKGSAGYLKEKLHDIASHHREKADAASGLSLQDRLFAKLLQQVVPEEDVDDGVDFSSEKHTLAFIERPPFSLPVMTNNFRRFNARIGIVFVFQNRLIKLFNWRRPTQTLSFLFIYSFICLDPYLLPILPVATLLFFVMVPAFLTRHPPPPPSASTSSTTAYYSYHGPALAPPQTIKPASETSKDFFRNMRDLQNSMADFATLHDATVSFLSPPTNFSNETLSSTLFLLFTMITAILFIASHLMPWRFLFLIGGNAAIIVKHPNVQSLSGRFKQWFREAKERTELMKTDGRNTAVFGISLPSSPAALINFLNSAAAISLDSYPEEREVEIFELQHKIWSPYSSSSEWEPFLFTSIPYDPLSPSRIAGDRPKGTRFFEDVRPPPGWTWKGKKWELDLECREWVLERMITGVEFEIQGSSGDGVGEEMGGWVWDLPFHPPDEDLFDHSDNVAYGDQWEPKTQLHSGQKENEKQKGIENDWEEGTGGANGTGEWRRRRWVRIVQRVGVGAKEGP